MHHPFSRIAFLIHFISVVKINIYFYPILHALALTTFITRQSFALPFQVKTYLFSDLTDSCYFSDFITSGCCFSLFVFYCLMSCGRLNWLLVSF